LPNEFSAHFWKKAKREEIGPDFFPFCASPLQIAKQKCANTWHSTLVFRKPASLPTCRRQCFAFAPNGWRASGQN